MGKKDKNDITEGILNALGAIGVTWLGLEILKSLSKKEVVYDCPVCNFSVKYGVHKCPNCHSILEWPK